MSVCTGHVRPVNRELRRGARNTGEELASVIVFSKVGDACGGIDGCEVRAVETAWEVLGDTAAQRRARIDADKHEIHCCGRVKHGNLDHVRTFILKTKQAVVGEIRGVGPGCHVT